MTQQLYVEEAWEGEQFIGWRVTTGPVTPETGVLLVFQDNALNGFRIGEKFIAAYGRTIEYRPCTIAPISR